MILVTGAGGQTGQAVVRAFVKRGMDDIRHVLETRYHRKITVNYTRMRFF